MAKWFSRETYFENTFFVRVLTLKANLCSCFSYITSSEILTLLHSPYQCSKCKNNKDIKIQNKNKIIIIAMGKTIKFS